MRWGLVLGAFVTLAGCGGRAVSVGVTASADVPDAGALPDSAQGGEQSPPSTDTGGAENAGGGSAQSGDVNGGTRGIQNSGAAPGSDAAGTGTSGAFEGEDCRHDPTEYVPLPEDCSTPFVCAPGTAAFFDECGCGCDANQLDDEGTPYSELDAEECGGPSGPFALFESAPTQIVIGDTHVYFRVPESRSDSAAVVWAMDKQTRAVAPYSGGSVPESMPGSVVSGAEEYDSGGVSYSVAYGEDDTYGLWARTGENTRLLFDLSDREVLAFIVVDSEFYGTDDAGRLLRGLVAPSPVAPVVVEQRGNWDDDDYMPFVGADADAVYWLSGPLEDARVSDDEPLELYRTCR